MASGSQAGGASELVRSQNIEYLVGVDHLRAFAALLVVSYHGVQLIHANTLARRQLPPEAWAHAHNPLSALLIEGHTAVALFMVLSAFLFTHGAARSDVSYWPFLKNRFLRTYPLFLVFLFMGMGAFTGNVTLERVVLISLGFGCFSNLPLSFGAFSGMFWAIGVEWQFYVAFPFLLRLLRPTPFRSVAQLLGLALLMRWSADSLGSSIKETAYWTMLGRVDQFLVGMLAGLVVRRLPRRALVWLLAPSLAVVLGSLWLYNRWGGWPAAGSFKLVWPLWEGSMWAAFLVCYLAVAGAVPKLLSRLLSGIGSVSYSVYLWHFVLVHALINRGVFRRMSDDPYTNAIMNTFLILLPVTLVVSAVSYRAIERPFFARRGRYLRPLDT